MSVNRHVIASIGGAALLVAACGSDAPPPGKTPTGARASCAADADCVISTGEGCCKACAENPHAIPGIVQEQQRSKCAAVDCAASSDRIECPKVDSPAAYVARCQAGTCAAVKR